MDQRRTRREGGEGGGKGKENRLAGVETTRESGGGPVNVIRVPSQGGACFWARRRPSCEQSLPLCPSPHVDDRTVRGWADCLGRELRLCFARARHVKKWSDVEASQRRSRRPLLSRTQGVRAPRMYETMPYC